MAISAADYVNERLDMLSDRFPVLSRGVMADLMLAGASLLMGETINPEQRRQFQELLAALRDVAGGRA